MPTVTIRKDDGSDGSSLELSGVVFGAEPNPNSVRAALNNFMANQRAGTHATRNRARIRGGGAKPWRQKGTGRARQGSVRAVQWRGGAIAFGPQPRDYAYRINRKVRRSAYRTIWSDLVRDQRLIVLDGLPIEQPKTRRVVELLDRLACEGTVMIVTRATNQAAYQSARNIPWVTMVNVDNVNIYDLMTHDHVVITKDAIQRVEEIYQ
mgnify:CR=1 FL=1